MTMQIEKSLKEQIAKILHPNVDYRGTFDCCVAARVGATSILALVRESVEKVENPYKDIMNPAPGREGVILRLGWPDQERAFEQARQTILKELE